MKSLVVDDEFTSRLLLQDLLKAFGDVHIAVNGQEAVDAVWGALKAGDPYDLICMDIMMPELDGHEAVQGIRALEAEERVVSSEGAKILMTTALGDIKNLMQAFGNLCDGYLVKPLSAEGLNKELSKLGLIA